VYIDINEQETVVTALSAIAWALSVTKTHALYFELYGKYDIRGDITLFTPFRLQTFSMIFFTDHAMKGNTYSFNGFYDDIQKTYKTSFYLLTVTFRVI